MPDPQPTDPSTQKEGLWKKLQDNIAFLASIVGILTFLGGFIGWEAGSGKAESRVDTVVHHSDEQLRLALEGLPAAQREALAPLIAAIQDLTLAPAAGQPQKEALAKVEAAAQEIGSFSRMITVKSYSAETSPVTVPVGETLMICNNKISLGLPTLASNNTRAQTLIQGRKWNLAPGMQRQVTGPVTATVTVLEILPEAGEVVYAFDCISPTD